MSTSIHKRHIAKSITWRMLGTLDTFTLSWIITGNALAGLKISGLELFTKMILYYCHEQVWYRKGTANSKKRHVFKTFTWRMLGTLDTMFLAWLITGNPLTGFHVGLAEVVTKMVLYYLHERSWYRFDFGLEQRNTTKK